MGFDFAGNVDELPKARRIAQHFGTDHHEIHVGGADVRSIVEKMVHHHDAPFADAANIPLYMMAEGISSHTKVVLQGDGGDELFGGYRRYATLRYYRVLRMLADRCSELHGMTPKSPLYYRIQRYLHAIRADDLAHHGLAVDSGGSLSDPLAVFAPGLADARRVRPIRTLRGGAVLVCRQDIGNQMSLTDILHRAA